MSYVFGGKTDCLYTNAPLTTTHFSLCYQSPLTPLQFYADTLSQTLPGDNLVQSERSVITRDNIIVLLHSKQKATVQLALHKHTHTNTPLKRIDPLTCLSWRRLANTDSLKLLFTCLHTTGNGWGRGPVTNVTTPIYKRGKKATLVKE